MRKSSLDSIVAFIKKAFRDKSECGLKRAEEEESRDADKDPVRRGFLWGSLQVLRWRWNLDSFHTPIPTVIDVLLDALANLKEEL